MSVPNSFIPVKPKERPVLLVLSVVFSLLLHLLIVALLYQTLASEKIESALENATVVRLVDTPKTEKPKQIELDQQPAKPAAEPPVESSRLAEQNQQVEKEMAPKGDDVRDQKARPEQSQPAQQSQQPTPAVKQEPVKPPVEQTPAVEKLRPTDREGKLPAQKAEPTPSLEQLTQLTPSTIGRIARNERALQERIKERSDLETGDTVWLNLERGNLISFFRRFRNQIEGVWNYPQEAILKEQQGTLLLKITVDRDGELLDVDLLRSSGSEILDYEAIQAVYRAAPFGPLGRHYQHPDLKIMAHFSYRITGKFIYGKPY